MSSNEPCPIWKRAPSASDRMLTLLRELIRSDDAGEEPSGDLQMAAGGCRDDKDLGAGSAALSWQQFVHGRADAHAIETEEVLE